MTEGLHIKCDWQYRGEKRHIDWQLKPGITALMGPSGAGKTSVARMIAGLDHPKGGIITHGNQALYDKGNKVHRPAFQRAITYTSQEPALFPHLTVGQNINFANTRQALRIQELIEFFELTHLLNARPHQISGGEARRVAFLRAVASNPKLLILDEPFTGLDAENARKLRSATIKLTSTETSILIISHQTDLMLSTTEHAALMVDGDLITSGDTGPVLDSSAAVAIFGQALGGSIFKINYQTASLSADQYMLGPHPLCCDIYGSDQDTMRTHIQVRSRDVAISPIRIENSSIRNQLPVTITQIDHRGSELLLCLKIDGIETPLTSLITEQSANRLKVAPNMRCFALIKAASALAF